MDRPGGHYNYYAARNIIVLKINFYCVESFNKKNGLTKKYGARRNFPI
jgi:hypothetical protein